MIRYNAILDFADAASPQVAVNHTADGMVGVLIGAGCGFSTTPDGAEVLMTVLDRLANSARAGAPATVPAVRLHWIRPEPFLSIENGHVIIECDGGRVAMMPDECRELCAELNAVVCSVMDGNFEINHTGNDQDAVPA